jgi:phenylacetate-CoA ligase
MRLARSAVPWYEARVRSGPAAMELSVLAPCYNEEANLPELARRVGAVFRAGGIAAGELILVDDGSSDRTWEVIERLVREYPFVVGRRHVANRGITEAWKTGLAASSGRLVCLIDADLQNQPEDMLRLKRELELASVDIVQGWRSPLGRARNARYWCSRGFNLMLNAAFGMDLRDNKSGFVLCPRGVLNDLLRYQGRYFYWHPFIMVAARRKGYAWGQVETVFGRRRAGKSFLSDLPVATIARSLVDLGRALVEYRLRRERTAAPIGTWNTTPSE